jgi:hypothetical protein
MCTLVRVEGISPQAPQWRRDDVVIVVSDQLTTGQRLLQIRALLSMLGAPQCQTGATCWCGEPVTIPGLTITIPAQRTKLVPRQRIAVEA